MLNKKITKILSILLLITGLIVSPITTNAVVNNEGNDIIGNYVSDELIVNYTSLDERILKKQGYELLEVLNDEYALVETSRNSLLDAMNHIEKVKGIESVQPNYVYTAADLPNDTRFNELWGLHNTGQAIQYQNGIENIDINLPETYERIGNNKLNDVVVAVIDTGIDVNHPDLKKNMWVNEKELNGLPGVDDDGNGYVDDIYGYDFFNNDGTVYDENDDDDHGTHVAGTIAGVTNNQIGITGIAANVKIMSLKFLGTNGRGSTAGAIRAIEYAKKMGVKISNNSWGGEEYDTALKTAIEQSGMLFIAAAGNDGKNIDKGGAYPSAYNSPNILSVTAIDNRGQQADFSNYGKTNTDIAAPGVAILSTLPENNYGYKNGTSMATPHVTGAAALAMGYNSTLQDLKAADFIKIIKDSGTTITGAKNTSSGKMLNAYQLINDVTPLSASTVSDVYDTTKVITGSTTPNTTVTIKVGTKQLGTATADAAGKFKISLSAKQVMNTRLSVSFKNGTRSYTIERVVKKDNIKPQLINTLRVTNVDKIIAGTVDEEATIKLELAGKIFTAKTDASGKFIITTGTLLLGQQGNLIIEDTASPANKTEISFTVIDGVKPILKKINTIYNTTKVLSGEVSEPSNLKIYFANYSGGYSKEPELDLSIKQEGPFTMMLNDYPFGYLYNDNIKLVLEDEAGNTSLEKIVKVLYDKTAPKIVSPKKLELDDRGETSVNVAFDEQVEFYIYINNETYSYGRSAADGKAILELPKLEKKSTVSINYYDYNWNKGTIKTTVLDKTAPVITKVNPIYNTTKAISGLVSEKSTVTAKVDGKQVATAKTDASGNFILTLSKPVEANKTIEFTAVDDVKLVSNIRKSIVLKDVISPTVEMVNISDANKSVSGKLSEEANITLYKVVNGVTEAKALAKGKTDATGKFNLSIGLQKEGTVIAYELEDMANNTASGKWTVEDKTIPVLKTFSAISNTSTTFSGEVSETGTLKIYTYANKQIGNSVILSKQVNEVGKFNFSVQSLYFLNRINEEVAVKFVDKAGNESTVKVLKVTADKTAPKLLSPTKIDVDDTKATSINGILNEKGTVKVERAGKQIASAKTGYDGSFTLEIPQQKANTKLDVTFTDENGNSSKAVVTVVDKTKPTFIKVNSLFDTQKYISGVLSEKGTVTATTVVNGKTTTIGSNVKTDADGNFTITLKTPLTNGTIVSLTAKDEKGLVTEQPFILKVINDNVYPEVVSLKVNDAINAIEGVLSEEATISIKYTTKDGKEQTIKNIRTDIYGAFKGLKLTNVKVGSLVEMYIEDGKGFITSHTFIAQDSTPPVITKVSKFTVNSKVLTGTVSEGGIVQLYKVSNGEMGNKPVLSLVIAKAGMFQFELLGLDFYENDQFVIRAIDTQGNEQLSERIVVFNK